MDSGASRSATTTINLEHLLMVVLPKMDDFGVSMVCLIGAVLRLGTLRWSANTGEIVNAS